MQIGIFSKEQTFWNCWFFLSYQSAFTHFWQLSCPYVDADHFHSAGNITKMKQGTPLTDEVNIVAFVTFRQLLFYRGKQVHVSAWAKWRVYTRKKNDVVCPTTKNGKRANTGHFWTHLYLSATKILFRTVYSFLNFYLILFFFWGGGGF